jgi:hypothetical protein
VQGGVALAVPRSVQRHCCVGSTGGMLKARPRPGSDCYGELVERDGQPPGHQFVECQLVMPAA